MVYIVLIIFILIVAMIAVIYHDTHSFVVRNYEVRSDKVGGDYRIVFLTDLHGYEFGKGNEKLLAAIRDQRPDAIVCGGDMFNAKAKKKKDVRTDTGLKLLKELAGEFTVFAANGNHERKVKTYTKEHGNLFSRYKAELERANVKYLEDDSFVLENRNIRITGLDTELEYFRKFVKTKMDSDYLESKLGKISSIEKGRFQILLAHNPQYFKEYCNWGADLTLAGHFHGGIVRLPFIGGVISPAFNLFPRYSGGRYESDDKVMILSCGLGTHTINVRMFNPGEVSVIDIKGV
ncbi:MAG: metallophosphoesterase [Butyrivibrio sp.]|nr:metallophosphoesterase [Butyrivibrio sp.]